MDIKEIKSVLEMRDLYFSKFMVENNRVSETTTKAMVDISYNISGNIDEQNRDKCQVQIDLNVTTEDEKFSLFLQTVGCFEIVDKTMDEQSKNFLLKRNTISIMFPFIRSQVALMTTQPGMQPIMLEPIDVNALIEKTENRK